ncbi:MAG: type II toxin-antitoxin system VapB family antitoxin [Candidatus Latescibacteria bacterium]|nr:type II toxin-antitoxin system VapB family antitoxin [Candidatus Latescibacterota bacterium]
MKTAKLFANGRSQAVRLPREFRFEGSEVYIKRLGKMVVLLPQDDPWAPLVESLDMFSDDFMKERNQPSEQMRDDL